MTKKIYQERLRKSNRLMKAAGRYTLAYQTLEYPSGGKSGKTRADVKDVKALAHFEAENIYFRQNIR